MTVALLSPGRPDGVVAVRTRPEDRWSVPDRLGRFSFGMIAVIVVSLGLHAVVVGTAVISGRQAPVPQEEIAVEIVKEVPKEAPDATKTALDLKPALPPAKPDTPAKMDANVETPPKTENAKREPADPEQSKLEQSKPEPPEAKPAKPAKPAPAPAAEETLKSLESELEALKAEHAALEAARAAPEEAQIQAKAARAPADPGLGPLPDSFQAVALPAMGDAAEEAMSYQQVVFSQLAKAKEIGQRQGLPGSAGVHFSIDEAGRLLDVAIVHKSGVASLDAEALSIVRKAAPFPPPPQGAQRSFDANVNFVVESAR